MSSKSLQEKNAGFGTAPVFFTAISTILGAIMFLRFGYAVGNVGFLGTLGIILIGHLVTIPTAMAIAEIATNQKVEGGGEYYIISRSFGLVIGSTIGITLYMSQAVSVAFYIMAFAEAFNSLFDWILNTYYVPEIIETLLGYKQTVSIPALFLLTAVVLTKGADLGVKMLYAVVFILFLVMLAFFIGGSYVDVGGVITTAPTEFNFMSKIENSEAFFTVFAIIFPAFTGMTAGVGLSGDLKNPSRSIPLGTMAGTVSGMIIYVFIAWKLTSSATPEALADTSRLVMGDVAWQGYWLIPVGLAAATISSALGSLMVAPRTLQAIARDNILPNATVNKWLSRGRGANDEPFNSSLITIGIAIIFIGMGEIDFVAKIISMFFMVTYGSLCLISFLQHFAADPAYRPSFRSKWYLSLLGALMCFGLMFLMDPGYAIIAVVMLVIVYLWVNITNGDKRNLAEIFQGVIFQTSRQLQVFLQKAEKEQSTSWRPSIICISKDSFERIAAFDLLRWMSQKYGFGTYIHQVEGYLSRESGDRATKMKERLIRDAEKSKSNVYIDTMVTPSMTSAIAQVMQFPGISGKPNNLLFLEYAKLHPDNLDDIVANFKLIKAIDFDLMILATSERGFGHRKEIHIWITSNDYENANLMILIAYIIVGHSDWEDAHIKIMALYPDEELENEKNRLLMLIETGRLPISSHNIELINHRVDTDVKNIVAEKSAGADLTIMGFRSELVANRGKELFEGYDDIGNILFVNSAMQKEIK
ncbi:APC family permease [Aureispira anguillae]|uniref:Amino acid permease n=1 Tax=Aureispira anguillae TaxID=2864201 RepID=A0A916DRF1_9BACT|nr:amino acid permease [Aureispira anguillae]BDS11799.1 amino acid permease [Aureispira anguillae]